MFLVQAMLALLVICPQTVMCQGNRVFWLPVSNSSCFVYVTSIPSFESPFHVVVFLLIFRLEASA